MTVQGRDQDRLTIRPWQASELDRVGRRVQEFVEPLLLVGSEARQDVVDGIAVRLADPHPEPAELLGPELVDDRAEAVVTARTAAFPEAQLAERQGEVVGDHEDLGQRRALSRQHLAHGDARKPGYQQRRSNEPPRGSGKGCEHCRWKQGVKATEGLGILPCGPASPGATALTWHRRLPAKGVLA